MRAPILEDGFKACVMILLDITQHPCGCLIKIFLEHAMTNTPFNELQARITGEVHSDALRCLMLATDGSIFQEMPACVVYPRTAEDVAETVRFAGKHNLTLHPRGAGSGLTGAALGLRDRH